MLLYVAQSFLSIPLADNIPRTVRFPEPLFEQLNRAAGRNGVSFNLLVLQCCKYALENMEEAPEEN